MDHAFGRHAQEWYGGHPKAETHMADWRALMERAAKSTKVVEWSSGNVATYGHLIRVDGKYLFVQFERTTGKFVTAYPPNRRKVGEILKKMGK
ncbi:hypothetical protein ACSNOI_04035 [Actinomadura kijaniata]|uniref:hypothetical protein n=1 Tax=Actinomadura kijaniata TaxID=46161 RepID=UPI003F1A4FF4